MFSSRPKPLWWIVAEKEAKEILRSPLLLALSFLLPIFFLFILGFGINLDVENIPIAIVDHDNTVLSREFADSIYNNKYFALTGVSDKRSAIKLLKTNRLRAIVVIPENFEKRIREGRLSEIQILIDGTYPYRADVIRGYMASLSSSFTEKLIKRWLEKRGLRVKPSPVHLVVRSFYNQSMLSAYSLVPGLFVIILFINLAVLSSLSIAREKDYGTIVNILTSKISRLSFVWGKVVPYFLAGLINLVTLLILSLSIFHLPFRGNLLSFFVVSSSYILATCFFGTFVSSFSKTMIGAQFAAMVIAIIPSFLYSGFLMPVSSLGKGGKIEALLLPCKYYMDSVRGIFLKGFSLSESLRNLPPVLAFAFVMLALSVILFKKREG